MNAATVPPPDGAAFLKAVTELGQRRRVVTSRAIYNDRGIKLLEGGVVIDATLYDRLVSHRLKTPLDECVDSQPAVTAAVLRETAQALVDRLPFFAQMAPPGRIGSKVLEAIEAIPLPGPVAFQLTLARETNRQKWRALSLPSCARKPRGALAGQRAVGHISLTWPAIPPGGGA